MKKICFVQYNLGAVSETFLSRHLSLLQKEYKVYCITGSIVDPKILSRSSVFQFTKQPLLSDIKNRLKRKLGLTSFVFAENILEYFKLIQPNLIVFQFSFIPVLLIKEIHKLQQPFAIIHHGTDLNRARIDLKYREDLKIVWSYASKIIFISDFLMKEGLKLGCPEGKMKVLGLGVPIPSITSEPTSSKSSNIFKILSVGRLEPVKNHKFLIEAFHKFNMKHPNSELTIVGDGSEKISLKELVVSLQLEEKIKFTGSLPFSKVKSFLQECDVLCLVSKRVSIDGILQEEGLPITLIEGAACSKPLIGTHSGGIPEIILHKETGLLVENSNINQLFEALEYLLCHPLERKRMGANGVELVKNKFDQVKQIEKFKKTYEEIMATWSRN